MTNLKKIISGGQTGVDQAALTVAMELNVPHGGWCPRGRRCETGRIPEQYQLSEMPSDDYPARTRQNVMDSDGTLIFYRQRLAGGTRLTYDFAKSVHRPVLLIALGQPSSAESLASWITQHQIAVLNIAGPREGSESGIFEEVKIVLTELLHEGDA